nr:hypothetical protein [uncultured Methanospirillum sp.]
MMDREQNQSERKAGQSCHGLRSTPGEKKGFCKMFLSIFSYCPYTMLGKKILRILRGENDLPHEPLTGNERYLKSKTTFGVGIILIGIFCPIFWISVFTGAQGTELFMSGINSLLVVLFGIFYIWYSRVQSRKKMALEKTKERIWLEDE